MEFVLVLSCKLFIQYRAVRSRRVINGGERSETGPLTALNGWQGHVVIVIYGLFCSLLRIHRPHLHGTGLEPFGQSRSNFGREYVLAAKRALLRYVEDSRGASFYRRDAD